MFAVLLFTEGSDAAMARNASAQQEGEWTVFAITLAGAWSASPRSTKVLSIAKDMPRTRSASSIVAAVGVDAVPVWLVTHVELRAPLRA